MADRRTGHWRPGSTTATHPPSPHREQPGHGYGAAASPPIRRRIIAANLSERAGSDDTNMNAPEARRDRADPAKAITPALVPPSTRPAPVVLSAGTNAASKSAEAVAASAVDIPLAPPTRTTTGWPSRIPACVSTGPTRSTLSGPCSRRMTTGPGDRSSDHALGSRWAVTKSADNRPEGNAFVGGIGAALVVQPRSIESSSVVQRDE